jgi:hypothetical protein
MLPKGSIMRRTTTPWACEEVTRDIGVCGTTTGAGGAGGAGAAVAAGAAAGAFGPEPAAGGWPQAPRAEDISCVSAWKNHHRGNNTQKSKLIVISTRRSNKEFLVKRFDAELSLVCFVCGRFDRKTEKWKTKERKRKNDGKSKNVCWWITPGVQCRMCIPW